MSSSKLYEEIGRLKQRVDDQREETRGLKEDNETLNEANLAMHGALAAANENVRWLNHQLQAQDEEIKKLQDQLTKAQRTIKVQSDQIATPSEHKSRQTPSLAVAPTQSQANFPRTPPPLILPPSSPFSTFPAQNVAQSGQFAPPLSQPRPYQGQQMPLLGYQPPTSAQLNPYPQQRINDPRYSPWRPTQRENVTEAPSSQLGMSRFPPLPIRLPATTPPYQTQRALIPSHQQQRFAKPSGVLVDLRVEGGVTPLLHDISPLFFRGETWAKQYCSGESTLPLTSNVTLTIAQRQVPSKVRDEEMPITLWKRIERLTNPQEATALLSQPSTRPLAITKLINWEITDTCLRPSVIEGFRPSMDQQLAEIRNRNVVGLPIHVRRGFLVAAAEIVQEATANPRFESWVAREVDQQTAKLWSKLGSLVVYGTNGQEARAALKEIWREAYRVGVKMACKASIFNTDFPRVGRLSPFNPATMVNKDYGANIPPEELVKMGATVRLAVTPVVMEWDFLGTEKGGRVEQRMLHFSNCLLSFPQASGESSSQGALVLSRRQ